MDQVTDGLRFPEGPVAMPDGSVVLTEIEAGRITRVYPDGQKRTVAEVGGGPNGLALGPDGKLYAHATTTCLVFDLPTTKTA